MATQKPTRVPAQNKKVSVYVCMVVYRLCVWYIHSRLAVFSKLMAEYSKLIQTH
jgi:hypothetical protein